MNIYRSASQLVGHTPLLQPVRYTEQLRLPDTGDRYLSTPLFQE